MGANLKGSTLHSYADDSQLSITYENAHAESTIRKLNSDLDSIHKWSLSHGIKLNENKCTVLTFPRERHMGPESESKVYLGNLALGNCAEYKLLGVTLDNGLTFTKHVSLMCQRAVGRLRILYRQRHLLPERTRLHLVKSLVLSVFDYCFPVYGNVVTMGDMKRMQRVQNMCVRFVCGLKKYDHVSNARQTLRLLPMADICTLRTSCLVYKVLTDGRPRYLKERLVTRSDVRSRNTRQDAMLDLPRVRHESDRKRFSYFAPMIFNRLTSNFCPRSPSISYNSFKKNVISFLSN